MVDQKFNQKLSIFLLRGQITLLMVQILQYMSIIMKRL